MIGLESAKPSASRSKYQYFRSGIKIKSYITDKLHLNC